MLRTAIHTKTCFSWEPLQQHLPLWSPSWLSLSVLAAKGKKIFTFLQMCRDAEIERKRTAIVSALSFVCRALIVLIVQHFIFSSSTSPELFCSLISLSLHPSSPSLLSAAQCRVAVMKVNDCECQIRLNYIDRTLRRQARVRAASHHPSRANSSAGKSNRTPHSLKRIRLWARREQWNNLVSFTLCWDQSEAALWLCCHGIHR